MVDPDYLREIDEDLADDEDEEDGQDCGRWFNGELSSQCSKAGSEECDWICLIGLPRHRPKLKPAPLFDRLDNDKGE